MKINFCFHIIFCISTLIANAQSNGTILRQIRTSSHDSTKIRLYTQLATAYQLQSKSDSAFIYAQIGIRLSNKINLLTYQSDLYRMLGLYFREVNKYNKAIPLLLKSQAIAEKLNQQVQIEKVGYALSVVYADKGDYKECINQIAANLQYAKKTQSTFRLRHNYSLLGTLNELYGNDSLAEYYNRKSYQTDVHSTSIKDKTEDHIFMLLDSVQIYLQTANLKAADKVYEEFWSYKYSPYIGRFSYLLIMLHISKAYDAANQTKKALYILNKIADLSADEAEDYKEFLELNVYPLITKIYLDQNNLSEALIWHQKSKEFIQNLTIRAANIEVLKNHIIILEKQGNYKGALYEFHRLQKLLDTLGVRKKHIEFLQISALSAVERQEKDILLLNQSLGLKQQLLEKTQRQKAYLITIISLLVLGGVGMFFVIRDIQRRRQIELKQKNQIDIQAAQLAESNQMKDKLFSIISHDLRSPIAELQGILSIFNVKNLKEVEKNIQQLYRRVTSLYETLDNLLYWSMSNIKQDKLLLQNISSKHIVQQIITFLSPNAAQKQITVINQLDDEIVYTNEHLLQVVIRNILNNAIKFTPKGGFVRIYSSIEGNEQNIIIRDSGIGISDELLTHAFINIKSKPGTEGEKGTGLGLLICKELMEKQGGRLELMIHGEGGTSVKLVFKTAEEYHKQSLLKE